MTPTDLRTLADELDLCGAEQSVTQKIRAGADAWEKAIPIPYARTTIHRFASDGLRFSYPELEGRFYVGIGLGNNPEDGYCDAEGNCCRTATWFDTLAEARAATEKFFARQPMRHIYEETGIYPLHREAEYDDDDAIYADTSGE